MIRAAIILCLLLVGACQTTSSANLDPVEVSWAKSAIAEYCTVGKYLDTEISHTDKIDSGKDIVIYDITQGEGNWVSYDAATFGMRDNVYFNTGTREIVCGSRSWKEKGTPFRPAGQ